ncbi:MAG: dockerin type I domain-containing protein [Planctomycetia bacterium]|jgi:hypothetical protein
MKRSKVVCFIVALSLVASFGSICQADFAKDTVTGLQLWLKADAGVWAGSNNEVTIWEDQSLNTGGALAPLTGSEPLWTTATIGGNSMDVLRFDGVDDVMTLGLTGSLITKQDHTVYFVTSRTGTTGGSLFGFDMTGGRSEDGWYYKFTDTGVNMEAGYGSGYAYQMAAPQANDTFFIGQGIYDSASSSASIMSGEVVMSTTSALSPLNEPTNTPFNIGAFEESPYRNYYAGDIAEILVYDHALTSVDQQTVLDYLSTKYNLPVTAQPLAPIPLELKAQWEFASDGSDSVGSNDLTLLAGATVSDQALHLTNSVDDGYATAASSPDLAMNYQFSTALWLQYESDTGVYSRVVARQEDEDNGFNIGLEPDVDDTGLLILRVEYNGAYYNTSLDERLTMGELHHLAFSFDALASGDGGSKITAWLDGVPVNVTDNGIGGSVQGDPVTGELFVGIGTSAGSSFSGDIDDLRFYTGLLTQDEVDSILAPELPGDANHDDQVDASDATILAGNWQAGPNATWEMGDFNGDGFVDASDATILAGNWQAGTSATSVPEPSTGILLALLGIAFVCLKKKRRA